MFVPVTLAELQGLGRRIDTELVTAASLPELYEKMNTNYPHDQWTLIRAPVWIGDTLVALLVRPRVE